MALTTMLLWALVCSLCPAAWGVPPATATGNMNGRYWVASGGKQDVPFNDDFASKGHEYFDVWAPEIATHYGEVFWTDQGNQPLPPQIVQRFHGKVIAITGYEMDQVMVTPPGQPGQDPSKDVSVPINWAYNHHYETWITGEHTSLKKVHADAVPHHMSHGEEYVWVAEDRPSAAARPDPSIPTNQFFSEGNGGESRKSFHGYPNGYAQLIDSPNLWHITPMQVDTRNRDCGVTPADLKRCQRFVPGPEPRQAHFGRPQKGANYSGVLECPCNSRFGGDPSIYGNSTKTKTVLHDYAAITSGSCSATQEIKDAATCFGVVPTIGVNATRFKNRTVHRQQLPKGCSVVANRDGSATVYYNTKGEAACTSGTRREGTSYRSHVGVELSISLDGSSLFRRSAPGKYCRQNSVILKGFPMASKSKSAALAAREQCERHCLDDDRCWGCSVDCPDAPREYGTLATGCQWNAVSSCGEQGDWSGSIEGDVSQKMADGGVATITVSGPAHAWFGVGLNARLMCDLPYALIVNDKGVQEQKLGTCGDEGCHCGGTTLKSSVQVVSNTVRFGRRTVVMTRAFKGITKDHYSFDPKKDQTMPLITSVGHDQTFSYHKAHGPSEISLTAFGTATCICDMQSAGAMCDENGQNCDQFTKNCAHEPFGDLLAQKNPTCSSGSYVGGLRCCHHKRIMLDADQEVRPELLRYHMKFRFWFQEYQPKDADHARPSHYNLPRIYYQTEAWAGEYDIPPAFALPGKPIPGYPNWPLGKPTPGTTCTGTCPDGPDCECIHTITYHWNVSNMRLIYAGGHCHAPSCLSMELYRNDTGTPQLLCRQLPKYGQGNVDHDRFDEAGYIALPPCLWGDDHGLEPSQFLPENTPMVSIKKNRNTHTGHPGEMASWQMRGVNFPASDPFFI